MLILLHDHRVNSFAWSPYYSNVVWKLTRSEMKITQFVISNNIFIPLINDIIFEDFFNLSSVLLVEYPLITILRSLHLQVSFICCLANQVCVWHWLSRNFQVSKMQMQHFFIHTPIPAPWTLWKLLISPPECIRNLHKFPVTYAAGKEV